ncbi:hypothetical protein RHG62_19805 [Clostridioides difficile]|nr:hypothetical protein [Clostridioides difficile]MDV9667893.1 hypothetical protein [Clostridioides difficile]MDV9734867.1 hypothetical protein [Clostridioides difficile]MDV9779040.1 hypothetical protein [Clostridioides difficile]MDV9786540.1 hypothetical protein [Clostridioides difficile]
MAISKTKCLNCGEEKYTDRYFWKSHSEIFALNKRLPVCKECFRARFLLLNGCYNGELVKALKHICFNFDVYFDEKLAKELADKKNKDELIDEYMKIINRNSKYKGKTSLDNLLKEIYTENNNDKNIVINDEIKLKWGRGFDDYEYKILERKYKEYKEYYEPESLTERKLFEEICIIELEKDKSREKGDMKAFNDLSKLVSSKMQDAEIKPSQKKKAGDSQDDTFGMKMMIYEKNQPVKDRLKEYEDVDGFEAYVNKHMKKPLAVALGLATGKYSINDGDKDIKFKDDVRDILEGNKNED